MSLTCRVSTFLSNSLDYENGALKIVGMEVGLLKKSGWQNKKENTYLLERIAGRHKEGL